MSHVFRAKMMAELSKAYAHASFLRFTPFDDPRAFPLLMHRISKLSWNVYAKPAFGKADHVLGYLGRYTHRVGLANSRLLLVTDTTVSLRTRGDKSVQLSPVELLRRFVQHVLPDGFHKIRHVGLYASASASKRGKARNALGSVAATTPPRKTWRERLRDLNGSDVLLCPRCGAPLRSSTLFPVARAPPRACA
jgi:hypothetical protein